MERINLTMAQALVRWMMAQRIADERGEQPLFAGVWAIFGHGNVAGLGEALAQVRGELPTYRAHNEQGMAHAAIAFAKQHRRRRMMACTTSIGPGATNMITAAALAHVNRLPVLFLPGDAFATRAPDPVLQQVEVFGDPGITANDCFRPVSRYFDRIQRPEQLIDSLSAAAFHLLDPELCGPVTLALPQDVQTQAHDYPAWLFETRVHRIERRPADPLELADALAAVRAARRPLIVAGGGVHYSGACERLAAFAGAFDIPVSETQAGKGALPWDHPCNAGAIGVTGAASANRLATEADLILAVGTRLQDFTTGSRTLFDGKPIVSINVGGLDARKHGALAVRGDADLVLAALGEGLQGWQVGADWSALAGSTIRHWHDVVDRVTAADKATYPTDAQVLGAVNRAARPEDVVVCAAGGLPGELHKLWRAAGPGAYHVEYGYSCMGYEIAGGLGVKMATPNGQVVVLVGDGSYLMLNSEIATAVMLGLKLVVVVLDNRGFGCINRLQQATGGAPFNNLLGDCQGEAPAVDFAAHARALGATAESVSGIAELEAALARARAAAGTYVISLPTDPIASTVEGGHWWDVAVPETSPRPEVAAALERYRGAKRAQPR